MAVSSKEECLIDTNILVYALDKKSPSPHPSTEDYSFDFLGTFENKKTG